MNEEVKAVSKKVKITLTVNASVLYGLPSPVTQSQIESNCTLSDDNNGRIPANGKIEDFTSTVYINQDVEWDGDVTDKNGTNKGYNVSIESIVYDATKNSQSSDENFFSSGTLTGTGGRSGKVSSKVKNKETLEGKHEYYTINFKIYPKGTTDPKSFPIDPKLRIPNR